MGVKRLASGLVAAGSALALTACGGGSTPAAAHTSSGPLSKAQISAFLTSALQKADSQTSFKIHGTVDESSPTLSGTATITGEETVNPFAASVTESGPLLNSLGALTGGKAPRSIQVVVSDGVIYEEIGGLLGPVSGGKPWIKIGPSSTGATSAVSALLANYNPLQAIRFMVDGGDLVSLGSDDVNGTSATHYHGTVSLDTLLKAAGGNNLTPQDREQLQQLETASGVTAETFDVWIDGQNNIDRVKETVQGGIVTSTSDEYMTDWGTPVTVTTPPPSQTYDLGAAAAGVREPSA